jgi:outer membrane murein-binding lipoprotein Lpp
MVLAICAVVFAGCANEARICQLAPLPEHS